MIPTALSRDGDPAPSVSENDSIGRTQTKDDGPARTTETPAADNGHTAEKTQSTENGLTPHNGHATLNGTHTKREKRTKRPGPSSRMGNAVEKPADAGRPALAVFCFEG